MNFMIKNIIVIFSFVLASRLAVGAVWEKNLILESKPISYGRGAAGAVELLPYGAKEDPKYFISKKFFHFTVDKFDDYSSLSDTLRNRLYNEICANKELYGSDLITSAFSMYFSSKDGEGKYLHMAMEPMLGNSVEWLLAYFLEQDPLRIDIAWLRLMLARTALGIDYMHKKGWAWFDVQPKNIFIDSVTGLTKIGDFGEGKRHDDMVTDDRSAARDWLMFGKYLIFAVRGVVNEMKHDIAQKNAFLAELDEAHEKLVLAEKDEPGEVQSLEQLKPLKLFKGFNWETALNGTVKSNFIPSKDLAYLNFILPDQSELVKKINSQSIKALTAKSFDRFVFDPEVLGAVNKIRPKNSPEIKSVTDFCVIMDPRKK